MAAGGQWLPAVPVVQLGPLETVRTRWSVADLFDNTSYAVDCYENRCKAVGNCLAIRRLIDGTLVAAYASSRESTYLRLSRLVLRKRLSCVRLSCYRETCLKVLSFGGHILQVELVVLGDDEVMCLVRLHGKDSVFCVPLSGDVSPVRVVRGNVIDLRCNPQFTDKYVVVSSDKLAFRSLSDGSVVRKRSKSYRSGDWTCDGSSFVVSTDDGVLMYDFTKKSQPNLVSNLRPTLIRHVKNEPNLIYYATEDVVGILDIRMKSDGIIQCHHRLLNIPLYLETATVSSQSEDGVLLGFLTDRCIPETKILQFPRDGVVDFHFNLLKSDCNIADCLPWLRAHYPCLPPMSKSEKRNILAPIMGIRSFDGGLIVLNEAGKLYSQSFPNSDSSPPVEMYDNIYKAWLFADTKHYPVEVPLPFNENGSIFNAPPAYPQEIWMTLQQDGVQSFFLSNKSNSNEREPFS